MSTGTQEDGFRGVVVVVAVVGVVGVTCAFTNFR